jgi:hydrogenase expression/formation protein HypD
MWRGIGTIPGSGWKLKEKYKRFDADRKFAIDLKPAGENAECIAGDIMKGIKKPYQCPQFGKGCTPQNPLGAPMVSSEGACAAYFNFSNMIEEMKIS